MKRLSFLLICMICCITTIADNWTDPETGYTWSYTVNGQIATIEKNKWATGSLVIPATINGYPVRIIGDEAFARCSGLTSITIPNSVTSIGDYAFYGCSGLTSVTIPNSVKAIGRDAFYDCSGLTYVTIPNSVTSIDEGAFFGCSGLTSITIPNSVTSIGGGAFSDCSGLTSIIVESENSVYDSRNDCNAIIESQANTLIQGCMTTTIPNSVTSIGDYAFYKCSSLTSITIPNSVTSIGDGAFSGCSGLTSITIPNSVTTIDNYTFSSCSSLTSVSIPNSVTSIGTEAFYGCSRLSSITIPNSVTSIGNFAFGYCGLTSVTIPNSVTSIDNYAFSYCGGLTSVTIGNSVTSIGECTFYGSGLISVTIGNNVTSIGNYAFYGCSGLTSVTIPNSVTSIGAEAFYGCSRLSSITIPNSVTLIDLRAFYGCSGLTSVISKMVNPCNIQNVYFPNTVFKNTILYVPQGTIDKYKATEGWNNFLHIEELNSSNMCATPTISYKNGKLSFNSGTEGAICQTTITDTDITSFSGNEIDLTVTYNISVYATKDGFENSDVATATLCWIEANPQNEGITTDVNQIASVAVLIKANGGQLTIEGAEDNTTITAYTLDGVQLGSAVSRNGVATINTNVSAGTVTIVKIGNKSVKVVMR